MKKLKLSTLLMTLTILIMLTVTACSNATTKGTSDKTATDSNDIASESKEAVTESEITTLPTIDRAGNEIMVPENIDSIISMAPSITETLISLGVEEQIVAADTQSEFYGMLSEDISYFDMMAPDAEQIVALEPDIVFVTGMSTVDGADPYKAVSDAGICVVYIPSSESIEAIYEDIFFIADCLQISDKGQEVVDGMKTSIENIKAIGQTVQDKKSVYFEIAAAPDMYSFGTGTFLNEMIDIIGATNILSEQEGWLSISEESVIALNPDVIFTNVIYIDAPVDEIKSREGWQVVNAVASGDVYSIDNKASSLPNQNIITALEQMAGAVYPDLYNLD